MYTLPFPALIKPSYGFQIKALDMPNCLLNWCPVKWTCQPEKFRVCTSFGLFPIAGISVAFVIMNPPVEQSICILLHKYAVIAIDFNAA
jgi:hypothetical protein